MFSKKVLHFYAFIAGMVLTASGVGKILDTTAFSNLIGQYGFDYLTVLSPVIAIAELVTGICLVLLINLRFFALLAFILLLLFTISFAYGHFVYGINDCGCFGTLIHSGIPPSLVFLRNFILLIITAILFLKYPVENTSTPRWKVKLLQCLAYPAVFIAGFSFTTPAFIKPNTYQHPFKNKNIKDTEFKNYVKTSTDSTYLIFCFSYSCPHCWNSIENLRQFIQTKAVNRVISFATGKYSDKISFASNFNPDFAIEDLSPGAMDKLTGIYPIAFYVEQDTIKTIIQSELPSPVTFNQFYKPKNLH